MNFEEKYARLLVDYCVQIKRGDKLYVQSTFLAEPLVKEIFAYATSLGAYVHTAFEFEGQKDTYLEAADEETLRLVPTIEELIFQSFDAFIRIRAPYPANPNTKQYPAKSKIRQETLQPINDLYFERTGNGSMRRSLCQYPTAEAAKKAGMPLTDYKDFVAQACKLNEDNPAAAWEALGKNQQRIVDVLNSKSSIHYLGPNVDLKFSCQDRIWINSDGKTNMPSGEVFTAPVEESVEGWIKFTYPAIYQGHEINDLQLGFEKGQVVSWECANDHDFMEYIFSLPGTRVLGEAAIGTNKDIQQMTKNILYDEKIGGTIHVAIGQSYKQNGGKNSSPIHWDMITDMKDGGKIYADERLIYQDGNFMI